MNTKKAISVAASCALALSCIGFKPMTVRADEEIGAEIPKRMQADTIIEYVTDSEYIILQGGIPEAGLYNENGLTEEEQRIVNARNKRLHEEMPGVEFTRLEDPTAVEGMRVYYDANGCIKEYKTPFSPYYYYDDNYNPLKRGTTLEPGTYTYGIYDSTIVITDTDVTGTGQITTFSDKTGESDNTLKKGDVATKGEVDNPTHGKKIEVTLPEKGSGTSKTVSMYKRDNGKLPHAVLDIWKTGVEYWGYTYSDSLSFMDGTYTYTK